MTLSKKLKDLQRWDKSRSGFPGEHWLALGAGMLVMRSAGKSRSLVGRMLGRALGTALIARSASGRDGALAALQSGKSRRRS